MQKLSSTVLPIPSDYSIYLKIFIPIVTVYCGLFMAISNHYVLKPKIQTFLHRASISSNVIQQLIIDFLSSLSLITFLLSSLLLTPIGDQPLIILSFHDSFWMTICCGILVYWKIAEENVSSLKIIGKNIIFLALGYASTLYHYFSKTFYFSIGLVYIGLYLLNLLINSYEERFINFINQLLGLKVQPQKIPFTDRSNKMPAVAYLAQKYPVSREELAEKMSDYEKKIRIQKINTKAFATKKLLQLALTVNLSRKKMELDDKGYVCQYFGYMNGTIRKELKTVLSMSVNPKETRKEQKKDTKIYQETPNEEEQEIESLQDSDQTNFIFYIFPVKICESSKIISTVFSVFINLGFGLLLDFCLNITSTLAYGSYFQFVYALLLLPILPKISAVEYFNSMVLFSLWKYCLAGIIFSASSVNGLEWTWQTSPVLKYYTIVQTLSLFISSIIVLVERKSYKVLIASFFVTLAVNLGLVYFQSSL